MSSLLEAFASVNTTAHRIERAENPQTYGRFAGEVENPKGGRHILGLVGGNEVSLTRTNWSDIESDLRGITRPNTRCPTREHLPSTDPKVVRNNPKIHIELDTTLLHKKEVQMWAYPATVAPQPLIKETCGSPEKY